MKQWIPFAFIVSIVAALIFPGITPLVVPATGVMAWWFCSIGVSQARSWGLRSSAVPLIWLLGALWFVAEVGADLVTYPPPLRQINLVLGGIAVLLLLVGVCAPQRVVRATGGPSAEWLVLRELHDVEWSLVLSLKVRPSWYDTYPWLRGAQAAPAEPLAARLSGR